MASLLLFCLLAFLGSARSEPDPCQSYQEIKENKRSAAYKLGPADQGLCDIGLPQGWYRFTSGAGGVMPEHCVPRHQCGTVMPVWMAGVHPTVAEGEVGRKVCVNSHGGGPQQCCEHENYIGVRNCSGFYVYFLKPTAFCASAYCAGDKLPCPPGKSSATGFTPCAEAYPQNFEDVHPSLSEPEVSEHGFRFNCDVNYKGGHHDPGLTYEVQWTFDGKPDPKIPNMILIDPQQRVSLPGTAIKGHLPSKVGCRVRASYQNRTTDHKSPWRESNTYWAGIKVTPRVEITEKGENRTVTVTSTIPIVCDFTEIGSCCLHLALDVDGPKNNALVPHPCHYALCKSDWNTTTHTASTNITITATKDQIRDGDQNLQLVFGALRPGGGGPYLDVFSGYKIPPSQVHVKDVNTYMCSWVSDPHFMTFNRRHYNMFTQGDFTIYENKDDAFEVQTRTFHCNGRAACSCSVAIREHKDVIRINRCSSANAAPKIEVATQPLRQGTVIEQSTDGNHIMVYLPSGREVKVDAFWKCLNTHLTVPGSDTGHGQGLCGTMDGQAHTDLTARDGHVSDHWNCHGHHYCQFQHFIESWRNSPSTSLFESTPDDLHEHMEDPKYCQCDTHIRGSPRINCTSYADLGHRVQQCGSHACRDVTPNVPQFLQGLPNGWTRKRQAVYVDQDQPDPPFHFNTSLSTNMTLNVTWPTASGITQTQAEDRCRRAIEGSQLFQHCTQHTEDITFTVNSCVTDVMYGDNFDMVEAAVAAFLAQCQFGLRQNPQNYDVSSDGSMVLKPQFADVCSTTCLRHGSCVKGRCVCKPGYVGDSCQLPEGQAPVLDKVRGSNPCDLNQRPCRTIYFDATHFQMGDDFKCKVHTILPDGSLSTTFTEDKAQFISGDRLACTLPDATDRSVSNFSVSVTYDGHHYSNSQHVTVYDSTCQSCDDNGCVQKADACLINDLCHQNGDFKLHDETKLCNTSASTTQWSHVSLGSYPQIEAPSLTGPDTDFKMSCAIPSTSHAPNARFRVTWYANDSVVIDQETLAGDDRVASISIFGLPSGQFTLRCKVSSFFAGKEVFSPELESGFLTFQSA